MKRREALRHLGFGLTSAVAGGSYLAACKKEDPLPEIQYDGTVAVIGAGAAGLCVADILGSKGVNVVVLEASKQLGGRIKSLRNQQGLQSIADFPVELGAEYFQGSDSVLGKIIDNMRLETVDISSTRHQFMLDSVAKDAAGWESDPDFISSQRFVSGIKTYSGPSTSVKEAAAYVSARGQGLVNSQAANFYGSGSERVGISGLSEQMKLVRHSTDYHMLKHNTMQDMIISRFSDVIPKVQLESPVKSINYSGSMVVITLENGSTVEANKVIVTVPVSILKNDITFTPALPAGKTSALGRIGMDPSIRVILDFKRNFWGTDTGFIWGNAVAPQMFNAGVSRSELNSTLTVTVNGSRAQELSNMPTETDIANAILAQLDAVYDGAGTEFIRKSLVQGEEDKMIFFVQDWTKEKYIKGGSSFSLVGTSLQDRIALSEPVGDNLFFAGEATDFNGDAGTISGALASAERAALEVENSIKGI